MAYTVIIDVRGKWHSDGQAFRTFAEAVRHRTGVAAQWSDCATAISKGGNVLA